MSLLEDRIAVVTGGSSGIGRGIALGFAEQGANAIVVADVREEPKEGGQPTHEAIEETTDASSVFVDCDVTDRADLESVIEATDEFGGVDVMVNNAGIWRAEEFFDVTEDQFQQMMDINLKGAYFGSQIAGKRMAANGAGSIINISSIAGLFGNGNWSTYSASKGGLTMLTYSLAHKLGEHGIRVNAIHPGGIETMIGGEATDPEAAAAQAEQFTQMVPLGRYGQPEDIAGAATFLASDLASYVTGESLVVDGGWTSWR
ncbi:3-ketoacyl-(acyl-carrier-protein) reductase [Halogeometricum pallidum JCM 14848]|uniref:3-ketoacyl-(Acyl-carrier-protein) reductase n=1 Tax=Halogeometricum pallidum JCM 14848 TaxID=1227487 RepID=M0DAC6_HALPD|nr:SDR family oxidoreductase [Halogeometricum pallidum]ELZ32411.1 3-ketoacyl-(acyl-carrier-protein) reductase [Halogeometricum pallidum JCM 14848]